MRFEILCGLVFFVAPLASCTAPAPVAQSEPAEAKAEASLLSLLSLLSDGDRSYVLLNCAKNWTGPESHGLQFVSEAHPMVGTHDLLKLAADAGLKPSEIATVVLTAADGDWLLVVELIDKETARRLLTNIKPKATAKKIGAHEVCVDASAGDGAMLYGERFVVRGTATTIETLAAKAAAEPSASARRFVAAVEGASLFVADLPTQMLRFPDDAARLTQLQLDPLLAAKRWLITADATRGLKFTIRAEFGDPAAAEAGKEALPKGLYLLRMSLETSDEVLTPFFKRKPKTYPRGEEVIPYFKQALADTRKALENPQTKTVGNSAESTVEVATGQPLVTAAMLMSLNPRAKVPDEKDN